MKRSTLTIATCATLLYGGTALGTATPQEKCDQARIAAWKTYATCVEHVVERDVTADTTYDRFAAFAKCRHTYFKKWTTFQSKTSLAGSTCIGNRFGDNGDQTVTDNLTTLVWEKKDNAGGVHDKDDMRAWSVGPPGKENDTAFTTFLLLLNFNSFGGANGWRLPTVAELQTIFMDFPCKGGFLGPTCICPSTPCIEPALDASNTIAGFYFTATTYLPTLYDAWSVDFDYALVFQRDKGIDNYVRAVRGGL